MEDLERYLNEIVDPVVADFGRNRTSVRHAFVACVVTFHSVDYLTFPRKSRIKREEFGAASADFALVDDVAHAFKHVVSGNPKKRQLKSFDVRARPPAVAGVMVAGLSRVGDVVGGVGLVDDPTIDLFEIVTRAVAFLRQQTNRPEIA